MLAAVATPLTPAAAATPARVSALLCAVPVAGSAVTSLAAVWLGGSSSRCCAARVLHSSCLALLVPCNDGWGPVEAFAAHVLPASVAHSLARQGVHAALAERLAADAAYWLHTLLLPLVRCGGRGCRACCRACCSTGLASSAAAGCPWRRTFGSSSWAHQVMPMRKRSLQSSMYTAERA